MGGRREGAQHALRRRVRPGVMMSPRAETGFGAGITLTCEVSSFGGWGRRADPDLCPGVASTSLVDLGRPGGVCRRLAVRVWGSGPENLSAPVRSHPRAVLLPGVWRSRPPTSRGGGLPSAAGVRTPGSACRRRSGSKSPRGARRERPDTGSHPMIGTVEVTARGRGDPRLCTKRCSKLR